MDVPGHNLYSPRLRTFVKHTWGKFQTIRWGVIAVLLGMFFLLPWLRIDDRPAVFLDIPARKFHILWMTFWPQDTYLLTLTLITAAIGLFATTAILGRVWCGYLCPQLVGMSLFIEIERLIEGDRNAQMRLAKGPWTAEKIRKRGLKHGVFILVSLLFSFNLVAYFISMPVLLEKLGSHTLTFTNLFWLTFFFVLSYSDFGRFRENLCHGPCPYGRFQGVMLDPSSLVVTYDVNRGEPRAFFKKGAERQAGSCVDCKLCVDVCPAAIDIRQGPQYECINCMRCADACDGVMTKLQMPTGLIRLATENELAGKPNVFWRKRLFVYAAIMTTTVSLITYRVLNHPVTQVDIIRNRSFVSTTLPDGRIANVFMVKALNMDSRPHRYSLSFEDLPLEVVGPAPVILAKGGEVVQQSVALALAASSDLPLVNPFHFVLTDAESGKVLSRYKSTFLMPGPGGR